MILSSAASILTVKRAPAIVWTSKAHLCAQQQEGIPLGMEANPYPVSVSNTETVRAGSRLRAPATPNALRSVYW